MSLPCGHDEKFIHDNGDTQWCLACEYEERESPKSREELTALREAVRPLVEACVEEFVYLGQLDDATLPDEDPVMVGSWNNHKCAITFGLIRRAATAIGLVPEPSCGCRCDDALEQYCEKCHPLGGTLDQTDSDLDGYSYEELSQMVSAQSVQIDILQQERKDDLDTLRNFLGDMLLEHPIGRVIRRCQDVEQQLEWAHEHIDQVRSILAPIWEGPPLSIAEKPSDETPKSQENAERERDAALVRVNELEQWIDDHCSEEYRRTSHLTFSGGHHNEGCYEAFHHGMDTVYNIFQAARGQLGVEPSEARNDA